MNRIFKQAYVLLVVNILACLFVNTVFAATLPANVNPGSLLPGSVEPGRVQQNYFPTELQPTPRRPAVAPEQEQVAPLGPEAAKIKFKLSQIVLEGNKVYTNQQLQVLYADQLNKLISITELQAIVQSITNYYRNNGYILSRAILPPQHVANGIVHVQVIEGYINHVKVLGKARGAKPLILAYGQKIAKTHPLQLKTMEYYLYLANQVPGVQVKAVLEPSKTNVGASDLNLAVEEQVVNAYAVYDNYGTQYLGPHQVTGSFTFNSIFLPGDATTLTYLETTHDRELTYGDAHYAALLANSGLQWTIGANKSLSYPGYFLTPFNTEGRATTYYTSLQYPVILSRSKSLTLNAGFNYLNSQSKTLGFLLYLDRIRPGRIGATYSFADSLGGSNAASVNLEKGFNVMGASDNPTSRTVSRFGADGIYTKWNVQASRIQPIWGRLSGFLLAQGQYSYSPVLASIQFGFGGSQVGRGYDPAEILGDRGFAGSAELRIDTYPNYAFVNTTQFYAFYDIGVIYNIKNLPDIQQKQSASSTGVGARFAFNRILSGNVFIAQPLTKQIAAEELVHRGRCPRTFFSIVASI